MGMAYMGHVALNSGGPRQGRGLYGISMSGGHGLTHRPTDRRPALAIIALRDNRNRAEHDSGLYN